MVVVENLNKWYEIAGKSHKTLDSVNLQVQRGEFVVLMGVSGSGKTTLLSIIAGLDKPSSGKVLVEGEPISKLPDIHLSNFRAKKIGMVFQSFNLIDGLSVLNNVLAPLVPAKIPLQRAVTMGMEALEIANIGHKKASLPSKLSGGERQRVAIARALVAKPNLILCDEPTANLDSANSLSFIQTLEKMHKMGKTIIVATHDPLFETLKTNHRVVHISDGKII